MDETLEERVTRLRERLRSDQEDRSREDRTSKSALAREDATTVLRFSAQVWMAVVWLWRAVPWARDMLKRTGKRLLWWYRALWERVVYRRNDHGERVFSTPRAGVLLLSTALFLWFLLIPLIEAAFDSILFAATAKRDEIVFLLGSQEIDSNTGAHIIEGCTELPCSDRDAIYFRTSDTLFNSLWSLHRTCRLSWNLFIMLTSCALFYPEYVGAAVPYSTSRCTVTSYGFRFRFPFRMFNVYSDMLAVTCRPYMDDRK